MRFEEFEKIAGERFPELGAAQFEKFRQMEGLYGDWNAKINVISRKDMDGLYLHHVLHSMAIAAYIKAELPDFHERMSGSGKVVKVLDLGTGGGFPGIPLAIMFPGADFLLCDSIGKKITVATEVAKSLALANVRTVNARAESLTETFDLVVSRAVTSLDNFYPWVKGKYSGCILYLKGGEIAEEIATLMGRHRLSPGSVSPWTISSWLNDPYFSNKFVVRIDSR